jgi:cellulose synthase/poly-beta-1,6-N-acetylglucosamine synthase-like glycosyltransferase
MMMEIRRIIRWEKKHHLIPHFIVLVLLSFVLAKAFFRIIEIDPLFFTYGITVTYVVTLQFFIAFYLFKDPYKISQKRKSQGQIPLDDKKPYLVSCLVAVYDEEKIIEKCVESISLQTYSNIEIIFVDDCSTDNTGKILDDLANKYPIRVLHLSSNSGKKAALAEAVYMSSGDIIAMTDSDSTWSPTAIEHMVEIFRYHEDVGAVSGYSRAMNASTNFLTKVQDSWYEGQYSVRKAFESHFGVVSCVSGPLAVFRREAIYNYMPAWENDKFLGQEFRFATDRTLTGIVLGAPYIGEKLRSKYTSSKFMEKLYPIRKYKVVYTKFAKARTHVPDTFSRMLKQQVRWKKSFIRNTFFTGSFYWHAPFIPMMVYYLHIIFVVVGPYIVFRHLIYLPSQGNTYTFMLYIAGIIFIGFMFGLAFKLENPQSRRWVYRPFMSLISTLILSWLIFYSAFTIKNMKWHRG